MGFVRLDRQPDAVLIQTEDSAFRFEEPECRETAGIRVSYEAVADGGRVVIQPCSLPVKRVKLRWRADLADAQLVLGDEWERGSAKHCWSVIVAEKALPWYFHIYTRDRTDGYGVMTDCNALCFWQIDPFGVTLWLDVRCGGGGVAFREPLVLATVVSRRGTGEETPFEACRAFCRRMCPNPMLPAGPVFGMNNWYTCYGEMSRESVLLETEYLKEMTINAQGVPYMVLDDGWQAIRFRDGASNFNGGPWKSGHDRMGSMAELTRDIANMGALPGIWFRPLLTAESLPGELFLKTPPSPKQAAARRLDPSHPEALAIIRQDVSRLAEWGYRLIKHDFSTIDLTGGAVPEEGWHFYDTGRTTAQIMRELYRTIQEAARGALVIGCNTYNHLTAGVHPIQRVGDDTSGRSWEWSRRNGVNAMMRLPQNGAFFLNDPDCAAFTPKVPEGLNLKFMEACALTGSALFASVFPGGLSAQALKEIRRIYRLASLGESEAVPADWMQTSSPARYQDPSGTVYTYDWYADHDGARLFLNWFA